MTKKVNIAIDFEWRPVGEVTLDGDGKLVFPKTTEAPGLYRFDWTDLGGPKTYIGEADRLSRRLQNYRTPGSRQQTNLRMNKEMREALSNEIAISLSTVTGDISIRSEGRADTADLSCKFDRVLLEHAALHEADASGIAILNS